MKDSSGHAPLYRAARKDHIKTIIALLAAGADLNVPGEAGRTALHWAAWKGETKTIAALTNAGADPNILDSELLKPRDLL